MSDFICTNVETGEEARIAFSDVESAELVELDNGETIAYLHVGEETYEFEVEDDYDRYRIKEIIEPN